MAKKKKTRRERKAQPVREATRPSQVQSQATEQPVEPAATTVAATHATATSQKLPSRESQYLTADLRRVGVMVAVCLAIEIGLWLLLRTPSGSTVYTWVKL